MAVCEKQSTTPAGRTHKTSFLRQRTHAGRDREGRRRGERSATSSLTKERRAHDPIPVPVVDAAGAAPNAGAAVVVVEAVVLGAAPGAGDPKPPNAGFWW